ncbi:DUF3160 domain-containing protein [bacterium]|nr:DUF3160 domain-containing protein [bacterium]
MRENYANWSEDTQPQAEFSDEELKEYLTTRFTTILAQVDPKYQPALQEAWEEIRKAETIDKNDVLFMAFTPDFVSEYDIKQDYTQFRPRSHYTNSSFLKTYFMASKWLMREKFYIGDAKSAQAALYLAHVLTEKQELATALE